MQFRRCLLDLEAVIRLSSAYESVQFDHCCDVNDLNFKTTRRSL